MDVVPMIESPTEENFTERQPIIFDVVPYIVHKELKKCFSSRALHLLILFHYYC